MSRLNSVRLLELAGELSGRERQIIETVVGLRLASASQLQRLYFAEIASPASRARQARRALARLVGLGVLARLENRRVGGARAGAAGHVFFAAAGAQRLSAYWQGEGLRRTRNPYEPTPAFVRHTLAITESYVRLVEADHAGTLELLEFQSEPTAWRSFIGPSGARLSVKPDAFVRVGAGEFEARAWLEIDCATEGRPALTRKCRAYIGAWHAGVEPEVFPRVLWITTSQRRAQLLTEVCATMPPEAWKLFAVTTPDRALELLAGTPTGGTS